VHMHEQRCIYKPDVRPLSWLLLRGTRFFQFSLYKALLLVFTMGSAGTPKMQYRFLGRSGLQVSAISIGGW
jgi:hypothetical protein